MKQTKIFDHYMHLAAKNISDNILITIYHALSLRLLRRGGLMAIDNVLWSGQVADPTIQDEKTRALRALNANLLADE